MMPPPNLPDSISSSSSSSSSTSASGPFLEPRRPAAASSPSAAPADSLAPSSRDVSGGDAVAVERRGDHSASCRWTIPHFPRAKARALWSRYFEVGGYDCRLLVYPRGDSQALPGYLSLYLQIVDPRGGGSSSSGNKWDCFASYRLAVYNHLDDSKSVARDSWHRFSSKKKSHGWCDFAPFSGVLDSRSGFLLPHSDSLVVTADILLLHETVAFSRDHEPQTTPADVLGGKFSWKVHNFSLFLEMIKAQKIMSPVFPAGDCNLRISVYQSSVAGVDHLSMCLESKDTEKAANNISGPAAPAPDRSCWCLFRMSVLNQRPGLNHVHRDSYGRFASDNKGGDNTSLGWNDYMRMEDFVREDAGFLVDDTAVFNTSFHVIRESSSFTKNSGPIVGSSGGRGVARKSDGHFGKFTWRIENFTRLKDLLKKRKITGLCIKSRKFQIGNRDCRLIVYPRGQSQPPCHLSVFLEVTDSRNTISDWSCFVSHRLSVVNQKMEEKSVTKESQNRYSKAAKDWGWREFVTLTSLFDQDSGFLLQDTVVFSAEVLILKETSIIQEFGDSDTESTNVLATSQVDAICKKGSFTWRVENFLSFKEIMETRKIFSKFFQAGGCELRIGVYESFDTICIYLESDQSSGSDPDKNFWVQYRMAIVNQKNPAKTVWKESSICTKTWNNSVLQFMKVTDFLESDAGFLVRDTVIFICEITDCCPWFEFSDLEVLASEDEQDALSTDPDDLIESEDSECISGDEEDVFRNLLSRAGFHLTYGDNPSQPHVTLREKLLMDAGAIAGFLSGLRVYLDNPAKVKRLLLPTKIFSGGCSNKDASKGDANSPSLMNLLMGVKVLQQAIIDLLLDIMVECCQPSEGRTGYDSSEASLKNSPSSNEASSPPEPSGDSELSTEYATCDFYERLGCEVEETRTTYAVQSSLSKTYERHKSNQDQSISPPETSAGDQPADDVFIEAPKTKWPEQSEELLGLIVNSLNALDSAVPQGCPEPRRRPQTVQKIILVLDKAPKHLQPDLIALVPKLVDPSEHSIAAYALLDHLQKPDADPSLQLPVFRALCQLEFGSELVEHILYQAFELLTDSNNEPLVAAMGFIFKAALQCQHLPQAVKAFRLRLKGLGTEVPQCVLDFMAQQVHNNVDIAEAILSGINSDSEFDDSCMTSCSSYSFGENGISCDEHVGNDQVVHGCHHHTDVYILVEMLSIPGLFVEVSQVFERALTRGAIGLQSVALVLERRHSQRLNTKSRSVVDDSQNRQDFVDANLNSLPVQEDDFTSVLSLGEVLSLSTDTRVQDFVRMLYAIMFKIYSEEHYRFRMLKGLVERSTNMSNSCHAVDIDMDVLIFLVREEDGIARPVLNMLREVAQVAQVNRANLWHQICAVEDENIHLREERQDEIVNFTNEKASLLQKINELEATNNCLKAELKRELEHFSRERKELTEQLLEVENQLEWLRSEKDEEIAKLSADRRVLQDRLHDAETQLSLLKTRKRDELKRVVKEKNALAERLKSAEAARKKFDEELKRYATETVTREEVRQSLENEVRRLTETVGQTEGEKREKEEQVARCEAYIDGMEAKLQACQQYIHTLEGSLQEEMSRHAPLYGVGLETLSMKELETLTRIHEEGLRQIHATQQMKTNGHSLAAGHPLTQVHGLYSSAPPAPIGIPPSIISNGVGSHGNGHINGSVAPWYGPS
ncbi:uncharacterized protein LOC122012707 isoform X1 [Zingiber officinale]|uniref:MATH domain-containing protein n=1 Tax=Zingiber officinale TaxID=94328 RepID=A0A8J5FCS6_ZINOF|nr:uncharacterized protein LOC122012707 isoform X1 [Zingiber officinale]KAG6485229.1 hypothetical protein ZIOFF_053762 [Zingiber officinale]